MPPPLPIRVWDKRSLMSVSLDSISTLNPLLVLLDLLCLSDSSFTSTYRGSYVVVDESAKEKALESGCKVACIVSQVLFYEQVRELKKSPEWPENFKSGVDDLNERTTSQQEKKMVKSDDEDDNDSDGLPPPEANTNRIRSVDDSESSSDTDA